MGAPPPTFGLANSPERHGRDGGASRPLPRPPDGGTAEDLSVPPSASQGGADRSAAPPPEDAGMPPNPDAATGTVSIWVGARGQRLWSVRVPVGVDEADLNRTIDIALRAEARVSSAGSRCG
jgi:hypothetical protein